MSGKYVNQVSSQPLLNLAPQTFKDQLYRTFSRQNWSKTAMLGTV